MGENQAAASGHGLVVLIVVLAIEHFFKNAWNIRHWDGYSGVEVRANAAQLTDFGKSKRFPTVCNCVFKLAFRNQKLVQLPRNRPFHLTLKRLEMWDGFRGIRFAGVLHQPRQVKLSLVSEV